MAKKKLQQEKTFSSYVYAKKKTFSPRSSNINKIRSVPHIILKKLGIMVVQARLLLDCVSITSNLSKMDSAKIDLFVLCGLV